MRRNVKPEQTPAPATQNPITYSYVYLRVQPYTTTYTLPQLHTDSDAAAAVSNSTTQSSLQFLICLSDPQHNMIHSTVTQSVPTKWLDLWDEYDWVEDLVVEAIRVGVEVIGQEYIGSRMGWDKKGAEKGAPEESSVNEQAAS